MNYYIPWLVMIMSITSIKTSWTQGPLYYGDVSENFVIRWAFQDACDFVFDPRTNAWPTDPEKAVTFDPKEVKAGNIIFVRDALLFFKTIHPYISHPYIIVTHGDYREAMVHIPKSFLDEKKIIAWFGIHPSSTLKHPKYFPIPLGIIQFRESYKEKKAMNELFFRLRSTTEKKHLLYLNFSDDFKPERVIVRDLFMNKNYCFTSKGKSFKGYLTEMAESKFTLSPEGVGTDCYRTWESLLAGSIPVVKKSPLDPLFDGLPVLIVDKWEDIDEQFLLAKYQEITSKKYDLKKLYVEYWFSRIKTIQSNFLKEYLPSNLS